MEPAPADGSPARSPSRPALAWGRWALLVLSAAPLLVSVVNRNDGDCHVYRAAIEALFSGSLPYRDRPFEYPPYAIPFFVLPYLLSSLSQGPHAFHRWFAAEMLLVDLAVKGLLLAEGKRRLRGWGTLLPCALFTLGGWVQINYYLKRYDLLPAALTLLAILALARGRALAAGGALAAGIGAKLYPVVLLLPLLTLADRQGRGRRLALGVALGLAPLGLLGAFLPWWRFLAFHAGRGLQGESLVASAIWWLHRATGLEAGWSGDRGWVEITGPTAGGLLLASRVLFAALVLLSVAVATRRARHAPALDSAGVAALLLLPLLTFIAFNNVLSPQYAIWYLPLAALAAARGDLRVPLLLVAATAMIRAFYPSSEYDAGGLGLARSTVLVARNLVLVTAWWLLLRERLPAPLLPQSSSAVSSARLHPYR